MADDQQQEMLTMRQRMHDMANIVQNLVTRDATMALQVTNLVEMVKEHREDSKIFMAFTRETLADISKQTTKTNGRVDGHDDHLAVNDREIKELKEARKTDQQNERQARWSTAQMLAALLTGLAVAAFGFWLRG